MDPVASPSRRLVAGIIDATILGAATLGLERLRGRPRLDSSAARCDGVAVAGCYFVAGTALAGRTAGQAVLGLRLVDEVTGRRPGWRASLVRWAVRQPPQVLLIAVSRTTSMRRTVETMQEVQTEIDELRYRYGQDDRELNDALIDLYQDRRIAPRGCWPLLTAVLVGVAYEGIVTAGVFRPPKRQGLHDRLAQVLVVESNAQRPARRRRLVSRSSARSC